MSYVRKEWRNRPQLTKLQQKKIVNNSSEIIIVTERISREERDELKEVIGKICRRRKHRKERRLTYKLVCIGESESNSFVP